MARTRLRVPTGSRASGVPVLGAVRHDGGSKPIATAPPSNGSSGVGAVIIPPIPGAMLSLLNGQILLSAINGLPLTSAIAA